MKLFELYSQRPRRKSKTLKESIKLCKSAIALLEAGELEWEPQPEFKGTGKSSDSGYGIKAAKDAARKQSGVKLNKTWQRLLAKAKSMGPEDKKKLVPYLKKLAAEADKRGFELSPTPKTILGLAVGTTEF